MSAVNFPGSLYLSAIFTHSSQTGRESSGELVGNGVLPCEKVVMRSSAASTAA